MAKYSFPGISLEQSTFMQRRRCVALVASGGRWGSRSVETIPASLGSSNSDGVPHAAPTPVSRRSDSFRVSDWGLCTGPWRLRAPLAAAPTERGSSGHAANYIARKGCHATEVGAAAASSASGSCNATRSASRRNSSILTFHRGHWPNAVAAAAAAGMRSGGGGGGGGSRTRRPGNLFTTTAAATAAGAAAGGGDVEAEVAPYLGPAPDLVIALDALSYTRTFTELCIFLENNSPLFRGPEVAALVLQAASVSELGAQRQVAAAMAVAERRSAELAAAAGAAAPGEEGAGGLSAEILAGAVGEALSAAGPGRAGAAGDSEDERTVLDELVAANQLLDWTMPLLRAHIKRYPPDAVSALVASLAQLQQYDKRLMELAAETFKSDPGDWLRRAAPPTPAAAADADPWLILVTLAGAFARLGHYDRDLMSAIAKQAVGLMPQVWERAEAEDAEAAAASSGVEEGPAAARNGADDGGGAFQVTHTVVALVSSFLELHHLDPPFMQAAGEHLAAFSHQLGPDSVCEVVAAFAGLNARNPTFYSLMLRRLLEAEVEAEQGGIGTPIITPRAAGTLYRACTHLTAMGDVPELNTSDPVTDADPVAAAAAAAAAAADDDDDGDDSRIVALRLSRLLRRCLEAFPLSALQAAPLGRPTPEQLEAAGVEVPELLEAWEATGLLTVPQILSTLQDVPSVEPLPPSALTAPMYGSNDGGEGYADDSNEDAKVTVVGGVDAVAWVPPDVLMLYDSSGSGSGARIAVKALDEKLHCCRNVGLDPDSEPDRPAPRSRVALAAPPPPPPSHLRGRLLRLRGPALSELRCLEVWGWRVLVVPVGLWAAMDLAGRRTWLVRQLDELALLDDPSPGGSTGISLVLGPELWV